MGPIERSSVFHLSSARENKKTSILDAFAARLKNNREVELRTALDEIGKIAWHRLTDAIEEE